MKQFATNLAVAFTISAASVAGLYAGVKLSQKLFNYA